MLLTVSKLSPTSRSLIIGATQKSFVHPHHKIMRVRSYLTATATTSLLVSLSSHQYVASLPWTRGSHNSALDNDMDDEPAVSSAAEAVVDALNDKIQVHFPTITAADGQRRNAVVESFFATSSGNTEQAGGDELQEEIQRQAAQLSSFLTATRRTLHQQPELMYQEEETSRVIQATLSRLGVNYTTGWAVNTHPHRIPGPGGYGVVADIGTGKPPCVLLRADMDALPILEQTTHVDDFISQSPGKMHACGHDAHSTMLLGAASILKSIEDSIPGTVRLMFQPAEEGGAGGKRMVEEGVTKKDPAPQYAFALHVWPTIPSGSVAVRPGPILAAAERFEIVIAGKGGHAAMPHLTNDPIVAASAIVMNLQTVVSRTLNPLDSGVVSITKMQGGDAFNVIPHATTLRGTIRALSTENLMAMRERVQEIMTGTAALYGCNVTITYSPDFYPPTVNDPELYEQFSKQVAALVSDEGLARDTEPTMAGEDFGFVAEEIPSTFFLLGQGSGTEPPTHYGLHHPHFALDESVMPKGVELHVNLALRGLQRLHQQQESQQQEVTN